MVYFVGGGAGFSGDRVDAAQAVVAELKARGQGGALIFETLGERTLALAHVARKQSNRLGYDPLLRQYLMPVLSDCLSSNIVIVGNFGAANPLAAAEEIRSMCRESGATGARIAVVTGDDMLGRIDIGSLDAWEGDRHIRRANSELVSANVYIGARAIADAIKHGANIVVTGRVADPSLVLGPLVAHFGWDWTDNDRLAAGTLAGHLLECGAQVTGGYFADPGFKHVPCPENIGYPIAEIEDDGTFVVTKPRDTGGVVDLRTVKEQLLYEIHDPSAYLTPDVVLDITQVELEALEENRVRVSGARGHPAPKTLKMTAGFAGDLLGESEISYAGPNAMARARLAGEIITHRLAKRNISLKRRIDLIGASSVLDSDDGDLRESTGFIDSQDVRVRLAVRGQDRCEVEAALQEVGALYCAGPAGGGGIRSHIQERINTASFLVPRELVRESFTIVEDDQ